MRVLSVSSEMVPWSKTGGLADVAGALPRALAALGDDVRAFAPLHERHAPAGRELETVIPTLDMRVGSHHVRVSILRDVENPTAWLVRCPGLFNRPSIYTRDADEHRRFLVLSLAALHTCRLTGFAPDIVHCNDWQAAMIPLLLRTRFSQDPHFARSRSLLAIHNIGYQGRFSSRILPDLGLGDHTHLLHQDHLHQGHINFLLHGILYAHGVCTVSPTYARQILQPEHGLGLDPFLRARSTTVVGILNGIDPDEWSPEKDPHIPHRFSAADLSGKALNRQALRRTMGLPDLDVPVVGIVSRLSAQKGFDLIPGALADLLSRGQLQLAVLGSGGQLLEQMFRALARAFPGRVAFHHGFSNPLAHLIEAGSDMFLMPSLYEPCGLNQMYSLRYGTVPIVHRTGGLADTVTLFNPRSGRGTGFVFDHHDTTGLRWAVQTAIRTWHDRDAWNTLIQNGMAQDFSWSRQARIYRELYHRMRS